MQALQSVTKKTPLGFVFVVIEKAKPYQIATYTLSQRVINQAQSLFDQQLEIYLDCQKNNYWPSYPDMIQEID